MQHEFVGFDRSGDTYHAVVVVSNRSSNGATMILCNGKTDGVAGVMKALVEMPPNCKFCPECDRLLPEFVVQEWMNGFSLTEARTGRTHWLSDGVDVLFDENENAISPGSEGFRAKWEEMMNSSASETREAYFPDEEKTESKLIKESYLDGQCPDCCEDIPDDVVNGQECKNCGHTFSLSTSSDD